MSNPSFDRNEEKQTHQGLHVLKTYFFRLLGVNMLFLICCIPVVTIPAAFCGGRADAGNGLQAGR